MLELIRQSQHADEDQMPDLKTIAECSKNGRLNTGHGWNISLKKKSSSAISVVKIHQPSNSQLANAAAANSGRLLGHIRISAGGLLDMGSSSDLPFMPSQNLLRAPCHYSCTMPPNPQNKYSHSHRSNESKMCDQKEVRISPGTDAKT